MPLIVFPMHLWVKSRFGILFASARHFFVRFDDQKNLHFNKIKYDMTHIRIGSYDIKSHRLLTFEATLGRKFFFSIPYGVRCGCKPFWPEMCHISDTYTPPKELHIKSTFICVHSPFYILFTELNGTERTRTGEACATLSSARQLSSTERNILKMFKCVSPETGCARAAGAKMTDPNRKVLFSTHFRSHIRSRMKHTLVQNELHDKFAVLVTCSWSLRWAVQLGAGKVCAFFESVSVANGEIDLVLSWQHEDGPK